MSDYIAFLHGGIEKPTQRPLDDGSTLANQCLSKLRQIENQEQFPPKLLFLLISAGYLGGEDHLDEVKARQLIAGVRRAFFEAGHRDIPLIGSSVAGVFFDCHEGENNGQSQIYEDGALLVCLASRMLDVSVSVATNVSEAPETAVQILIDGLDIEHTLNEYPRALPNRVLLTFFPGTGVTGAAAKSSTDKLHTLLLEKLNYQMPIVGGVSSANDRTRKKRGLQLLNQQTFTDALAACLIRSGLPLATSMAQGLQPVREINPILHAEEISDENYITRFREGLPEEIFKGFTQPILLRDYSPESAVVRARWLPDSTPNKVQILREVRRFLSLEATTPNPKKMYQETLAAHELSLKRAKIKSPAGCLSFKCSGHLDYKEELKLDLPWGIGKMKEKFDIPHYVGGFYDGEIATDASGAFICGGWSIAALIFGDEISERTAVQWGFSTLATHGPALTATTDLQEAFKQSLELVYDLGFPGAMICLLIRDHNPDLAPQESKRIVVATSAKGMRFNRALQLMDREGGHAEVALEAVSNRTPFVSHSKLRLGAARDLSREAGIINEYVLPLRDSANQVFALLRVDLGSQAEEKIQDAVKGVLNSIAAIVGAAIDRISSWQENRIVLELDQTLKKSMSANTQKEGLQLFIRGSLEAFDLSTGLIRVVNSAHDALILEAGAGPYYETAKSRRSEVSFENWSPSCEAFVRDATTIINDAPNNIAHKRLSGLYADDYEMTVALKELGSYANVPFKSENGERLGTISLLSNTRWFFNSYHEQALAVLGRRLSFLIDHLRTKEETREAIQRADEVRENERIAARKLRFIHNISRKFDLVSANETLRPNDICNLLELATKSLCEIFGAYAGAFYLWDEDHQQFILRGQFGWKDEEWIHVARYRKTDDWIGAKGLADRARYVPDLFQYYKVQRYSDPSGKYSKPIFGEKLSPDNTVEAIAAPVRVAGIQIGVLTLYGALRSEELRRSQFYTTVIWLIEEAVNRFGALVGFLLDRQVALEEARAVSRRGQLLSTFPSQRKDSFERTVDELINVFRATHIDLYHSFEDGKINEFRLFHRVSADSTLRAASVDIKQKADDFVAGAARSGSVVTLPCTLTRDEILEADLAATDGMIKRAALPLIIPDKPSIILDFHWDPTKLVDLDPFHYFTVNELEELGKLLRSLYENHLTNVESEMAKALKEGSQISGHTFGMMMAQCGHKIEDLLGKLPQKLSTANPGNYSMKIDDTLGLVVKQREWVDRCRSAANKAGREKTKCSLQRIIEAAVEESIIKENADKVNHEIEGAQDLTVFGNADAIREVFSNIINNAIEAMRDGGMLKIKAYPSARDEVFRKEVSWLEEWEAENVPIVFADNGGGIDPKHLKKLGTDFTTKPDHHGLGTVICEALLKSQNGLMRVVSKLGTGTTVVVALPSTQGGINEGFESIWLRR
jgi:GAF domain-containing protein